MSNCTVCGRPKSGNLDPFLCVRCVNEKLAWNDPQNWLPLARSRIDSMESEIAALRAALDQERRRLAWIADNTGRDVWLDQFDRRFSKGEGADGADDLRAAIDALLSGRGEAENNG